MATEERRVVRVKRVAIIAMVGGLVAGALVAGIWHTRWSLVGSAVSLAGYTLFCLADPSDRPPPRRGGRDAEADPPPAD